jgi:hypothetical protein
MSELPPEPAGPDHPVAEQDPALSSTPEADVQSAGLQETPHQPYDQQVPESYGHPAAGGGQPSE